MSFTHACFISYRDSDKEKTVKFIEQFVDALENCLDQRISCSVFLDKDRMKPGFKFNEVIAAALRESVCLVAILSYEYFKSEYCRREYLAMKRIEDQRRNKTGMPPVDRGLIIPVLVWATKDEVPVEIKEEIHFDPMQFSLTNLRGEIKYDPNLSTVVERIGDVIVELHRHFEDSDCCQDAVNCCTQVALPTPGDVAGLWTPPARGTQSLPTRINAGATS